LSFPVGAKIKRLPLHFEGSHMKPERRGATRYNFGAIAEVVDQVEPNELVAVTRDLSLSGVFVKTTTPFREGTRVRVRITHSGEEFTATGNVTANVMGIAFTQIAPNDRAILDRWLGNAA
jgi:PilZ domain-containing protein